MPVEQEYLGLDDSEENIVKTRDLMYRLMISQLFYDNYQTVAVSLSADILPEPPCPPSDRLFHLFNMGLKYEQEQNPKNNASKTSHNDVLGPGLDLEYETEMHTNAPEPGLYLTTYVTSHKGPCRACAFNKDGTLIATGSMDASIKILDVDRMVAKANEEQPSQKENYETHPVIRTLYDHMDEVTCIQFHPTSSILISGSMDHTVKLFDFSKSSVKKAFRVLQDADPVTCVSLHPNGDYLIVGTTHPIMRLYNIHTAQCFVSNVPGQHHTDEITAVKYSNSGKHFVTGSLDGHIKIWDGVSNKCVNTFTKAHDGSPVYSVEFSRNGKYVLSSGKDSFVKLWELSTCRCLIAYTGAGTTGKQEGMSQAVFNHTEDYVIFPDEATTSLCSWNSRTAARQLLLALGHNGPVRRVVHSPASAAFITCSEDHRARFWQKRKEN